MKVKISHAAMMARLRRALAKEEQAIHRSRSGSIEAELGEFYVVHTRLNSVVAQHVDPESWAREIGAVKPFEIVLPAP